MIANVVEYTTEEGGPWLPWPFSERVKPSNPELLIHAPSPIYRLVMRDYTQGDRVCLDVHAIKLDNGRIWDSVNGFRDGGGQA